MYSGVSRTTAGVEVQERHDERGEDPERADDVTATCRDGGELVEHTDVVE
jgi:hypothetical protein